MKKMLIGLLGCCLIFCGCQKNKTIYRDRQVVMGVFVQVISPDERSAKIVFDEMKRVEEILSKSNPNSEVNKLNQAGKLKASPDMLYVMRKAREFWVLSNGEFDITTGRLMQAWGFDDKNYRRPSDEELKSALALTGMEKVLIDDAKEEIRFASPGMNIDLGLLAKGYAVDCAIEKLKKSGIKNALINASGDIYCMGANRNLIWRVAVQNPSGKGHMTTLQLSDKAVAAVTGLEHSFTLAEKTYSGIFDPKTGMPTDPGLSGVSVIANDCLSADAAAVTIFILRKDKGLNFIKKIPGASCAVIDEKNVPNNR